MKKFFALIAAAAFALSLAAMAVAAEERKAAPAPAQTMKAAPAKKEAAPAPASKEAPRKSKVKVITGTVEALDAAAGTFSVKGRKETLQLKAGEKVKLDDLKVGDKVTATYSDGVASKVVASKKAAPTMKEGEMKKEAVPAPAPKK